MKKYIMIILVYIFSVGYIYSQPDFNQTISVNTEFTENITITPFSGSQVTGIGITGNIVLNSDTSFIRVIVNDGAGNEYLVYEMYQMLSSENNFNFQDECEESCFYDNFTPVNLVIQIKDASLFINEINWSNTTYSNASALRANAKSSKNLQKLAAVQNYIQENNLLWEAEETDFSKLSYKNKAKVWGSEYTSLGYEFYTKGIYSITGPKGITTMNHDYVDNFDWRNRHGANVSSSPYYDGDANGTGWMTPVVCQGEGCWHNGTFHCNVSEQDCNNMGGSYRTAGTCWIFGPTAYIEALTNLYYNEHLDIDLSEQYVACKENKIDPWITSRTFNYYKGNGVPDEDCLPYSASLDNCDAECSNPQEKIKIADYTERSSNTHHDVRQYLMNYGPVEASWFNLPWGPQSHSASLVGWGVIDEDASSIEGVPGTISSDWYGYTYWIYKESSGPGWYNNGFRYIIHYNGEPKITTATLPITSLNRTDADIKCVDKDGDGYYYWGIGPKPDHCPPSPDEKDGDDSDPGLGPLNADGTCTIINTYNASFEEGWDNWVQVGTDDQDWWRHTGPTPTQNENGLTGPSSAQDGSYYIYTEASCNGCYPQKEFVIESPTIDLKDNCQAQIDFYYHQYTYLWGNPDNAKLTLQVSYDEGATWSNLWNVLHDQGNQWHNKKLALPEGVNKVRFIGKTGDSHFSDIALDNITIGPMELDATPTTITTVNTIWNTNTTINSDVIIESGADLTIENCTKSIHELAKIIVEPGGRLIINNATLTSKCDKACWKGIQVWGDPSRSQIPRESNGMPKYQGELIVKNGGTIRNASDAIKAIKINDDGSYDWSKTGGIVRLNDAELINNKNGVWIGGYHNFNPVNNDKLPNLSQIINSRFETNNNFLSGYAPYEFIGLYATDKVQIRGNTFENKNTSLSGEDKGRGIMSYNASFTADRLCTSGTIPCSNYKRNTFKGLFFGIYHSNLGGDDVVSIKNNDFVNCNKSILLNNSFSANVINNDIQVGSPAWWDLPYAYGIYLNSGTGFKIEENKIYPYDQMAGTFGIIANNTGANNNELYKNEFNGLNVAINPLNCNRNSSIGSHDVGLKLACNENDNPMYDIWVTADNNYQGSPGAGIANAQQISDKDGSGNIVHKPVNNIFSSPRNTNIAYDIDNSEGNHINYYYEAGASVKYKPNPNNIENVTLYGFSNKSNNCPSQTNTGGLSQLYTDLSNAQVALNSSQTILNIWKDGGDADLDEDIELINPWEVYNEFNDLMAISPYLSEESLIAVIENPSFTAQMVKLLMIANPQSVNSDPVMDALYDREPPLPESYIDEILEEEGTESQLEKLEDNVAADYHNIRMIGEDIKRHYRKDTSHTWAKDSLIDFVSRQNRLEDRYELASIYLEYGQYNNMNACLSNIPQEFELTQEESTNHSNFVTVFNIAENVYSEGMHIGGLTSLQITNLENILDLQRPMLSPMALSILKMNDPQYNYEELVLLPDSLPEMQMVEPDGFVRKNKKEETFKVYPNPAHDYITVAYRTSDMEYKSLYIRIYNAQGKLVFNEHLKGGDNEELIGLSSLRSGSYIVKLLADKKEIAQEKLNIVN